MWFPLSLLALIMLTARRSTEKKVATNIHSMSMVWLQQAVALPFIIVSLAFAKFYVPAELPVTFWGLLSVYIILSSVDLYCYFKALSIADVSYVAPLMTLTAVGNILGAFIILGQKPTLLGIVGACLIVAGAFCISLAKRKKNVSVRSDQLVLVLIAIIVLARSYYASIEVTMLQMSNPTSYNFYTSALSVPAMFIVTFFIVRSRRKRHANYWQDLGIGIKNHIWPLALIGLTYTINLLATYQAKLLAPNAGYVAAVKSAAVLPIVLIGVFIYKEKVVRLQWLGIALIVLGLAALATN